MSRKDDIYKTTVKLKFRIPFITFQNSKRNNISCKKCILLETSVPYTEPKKHNNSIWIGNASASSIISQLNMWLILWLMLMI